MTRCVTVFVLAVFSIAALAADEQPVRAPYIEVGDCWSYRAENLQNRGPIDSYEVCVTFVDTQKGTVMAVATVKNDGREMVVTYSSTMVIYRAITGLIFPEGAKFLKFPLRVGDTYSFEHEFRDTLLGPNQGKQVGTMKVVGWEDIVVPAGRFHALNIEGEGVSYRYDIGGKGPITIAIWYVPEVNRHVKSITTLPGRQFGEELIGYRLNQ